jgi:prepilin-type processing-associated H-X9-DG protein
MSLVEVLVVLLIIATLAALLLPSTRRVREASARMKCQNNLKQLMIAMHSFAGASGPVTYPAAGQPGSPAGRLYPPGCLGPGTAPDERLSWMVSLLPYLEQGGLYKLFDADKGYAGNFPAARNWVQVFVCPEGFQAPEGDAVTHYVAMAGVGGDAPGRPAGAPGGGFMGYGRATAPAAIKDGTSNTVALVETRSGLGPWARGGNSTLRGFDPADLPLHGDGRPFGGHAAGMNAAMADGSVRFLRASLDPHNLAAAITIAGGESVNLE